MKLFFNANALLIAIAGITQQIWVRFEAGRPTTGIYYIYAASLTVRDPNFTLTTSPQFLGYISVVSCLLRSCGQSVWAGFDVFGVMQT